MSFVLYAYFGFFTLIYHLSLVSDVAWGLHQLACLCGGIWARDYSSELGMISF